jgi:hypothetical protein
MLVSRNQTVGQNHQKDRQKYFENFVKLKYKEKKNYNLAYIREIKSVEDVLNAYKRLV